MQRNEADPMTPEPQPQQPLATLDEIPYDRAYAAYRNTSFVPEQRAVQEQAAYVLEIEAFADHMRARGADEQRLAELVASYKAAYRTKLLAVLDAKARCASTMITGGSNFNYRQNAKRSDTADKRSSELIEWRERFYRAAAKALRQPSEKDVERADAADAFEPIEGVGWRIYAEEGRLCIAYAARTDEATYKLLRSRGFLWSRKRGAFVRVFTPAAVQAARQIVERQQ